MILLIEVFLTKSIFKYRQNNKWVTCKSLIVIIPKEN